MVRGLGNANLTQSRQLRQVNQKLAALREKIQSAPDLASLQSRIPVDLASTVGPVALQQPLPVLRAQLLSVLDQAQRQASSSLSTSPNTSLWPLIKRSLRVLVSAPAYAVAFAAMSVRAEAELLLLDRLLRQRLDHQCRRCHKPADESAAAVPLTRPDLLQTYTYPGN